MVTHIDPARFFFLMPRKNVCYDFAIRILCLYLKWHVGRTMSLVLSHSAVSGLRTQRIGIVEEADRIVLPLAYLLHGEHVERLIPVFFLLHSSDISL
jgi:hypothetical protein